MSDKEVKDKKPKDQTNPDQPQSDSTPNNDQNTDNKDVSGTPPSSDDKKNDNGPVVSNDIMTIKDGNAEKVILEGTYKKKSEIGSEGQPFQFELISLIEDIKNAISLSMSEYIPNLSNLTSQRLEDKSFEVSMDDDTKKIIHKSLIYIKENEDKIIDSENQDIKANVSKDIYEYVSQYGLYYSIDVIIDTWTSYSDII